MLHVSTLTFFESLRTPLLNEAAVALTALGSPFIAAVIIYTLYHFGRKESAAVGAAAVGLGGAVEVVLNQVFMRARPEVVAPVIANYPLGFSFPSGHTTVAFALATALELELEGSNYYFFLLAAFVGVTRLYLGVHWPGDVIAGALLGLAAGYTVHRYRGSVLAPVKSYI